MGISREYLRHRHRPLLYFQIAVNLELFGPLLELLGIISKDLNIATIYFKVSGIFADIGVLFFIMFVINAIKGEIDWRIIAPVLVIEGLLLYDVMIANVYSFYVNGYILYVGYTTLLGSVLVGILVILMICSEILFVLEIRKIWRKLGTSERKSATIFIGGIIAGTTVVFLGFIFDIMIPGVARLLGPLGIAIFFASLTVALLINSYIVVLIPYTVSGFIILRDNGLLIAHRTHIKEEKLVLLSGVLAAIGSILGEVIGEGFEFGVLKIGKITCFLLKYKRIIAGIFAYKLHPELSKKFV